MYRFAVQPKTPCINSSFDNNRTTECYLRYSSKIEYIYKLYKYEPILTSLNQVCVLSLSHQLLIIVTTYNISHHCANQATVDERH